MTKGAWTVISIGLILFSLAMVAMGGWIPEGFYILGFFGLLITAFILLIAGLSSKSMDRWRLLFFASVAAFGFSMLYIYSLGFILAPIFLILMVLAAKKLAALRA